MYPLSFLAQWTNEILRKSRSRMNGHCFQEKTAGGIIQKKKNSLDY